MPTHVLHAFACMTDEGYCEAYHEYVTQACKEIITHTHDEIRKDVSPEFHPFLDSFAPKFKFISLNPTSPLYGLPVLTQAPLRTLTSHLGRITEALKEVRHVLIFYQKC